MMLLHHTRSQAVREQILLFSNVEVSRQDSIGDELKEAIGKLKTGKAETLKVGSGDSAI